MTNIFDEYVSSGHNVDILKMNSVIEMADRWLQRLKDSKSKPESIAEFEYMKNYLIRCQYTIKTDQDINQRLANENAHLKTQLAQAQGERDESRRLQAALLEKLNERP